MSLIISWKIVACGEPIQSPCRAAGTIALKAWCIPPAKPVVLIYCQKSWCGMVFMVVLRNFSDCNGLWFYIPEISQNSWCQKISWACKKYRTVGALQRIFSRTKSCKSLNIMVPGAGDWQAAPAAQSLSNASPPGRVTQGNPFLTTAQLGKK